MANPTPYERTYSFTDYQAGNPSAPLPGIQVDNELENIEQSLGEAIDAIKDVRRSDGALKNGIVTVDSLDAQLQAGVGAGALASAAAAAASADAASDSAVAAAASATAAAGSATSASGYASDALTSRNEASGFSDDSAAAASLAQTARDFANKWAVEAEGVLVDDGVNDPDYSAYHWAQVALGAATGALPDNSVGTAVLQDGAITEEKLADAVSAARVIVFSTRAAAKAVSVERCTSLYLTEPGREGQFVWRTGNFASQAASDVSEAVYMKADAVSTSVGVWVRVFTEITPRMFGATGFFAGSTDDGPALNRMFDYVRALLAGQGERRNIGLTINLSGAWSVVTPINATNIVAWSLAINGGLLIGECTGKPIMDLVGSRGYSLNNVAFYGSKTNRPSCAYQLARPTADGFCDNNSFVEVSTTGWFSRTAIHCYGHETAKHDHCTYFNYDHTARVAIFEGFNGTPFTSDYTTVMTGATSFINNKVVNCDFRYLPVEENVRAITGVTNAASGVITAPGHQFAVNDQVVFAYVGGMPNMSKLIATVTAVTTNTITINQSTVGLGTYTSGGIVVRRQSAPSVYLSRAQQFNFDCCYIVAYGREQLEIDFPDSTKRRMEQIDLDIVFEGSGNNSNLLWNLRSSSCNVQGFRLKTYNGNATSAWFGLYPGGALTLYGADLQYVTPLYGTVPIAGGGQEAALAIFGNSVVCTAVSQIPYTGMAAFKGFITDIVTGNVYSRGVTAL